MALPQIFISYAHVDNETVLKGEEGWITLLHRLLELRLTQLLGERPKVWRDPQMAGNAPITGTLLEQLQCADYMISVISPRYLKSDWCRREIESFFARFKEADRIFKVLKTEVPLNQLPESVRDSLSYTFFRIDPDTGRPREFKLYSSTMAQEFVDRIEDLAYDLFRSIQRYHACAALEQTIHADTGTISVFLAETTQSQQKNRDLLRRELLEHGYRVLPDCPLMSEREHIVNSVNAALAESKFAIHLLDTRYGFIPEEADVSIIELQEQLSADWSRKNGLPRLIYLPPNIQCQDERQRQFISRVQSDNNRTTELVSSSQDELYHIIRDKLEALKTDAGKPRVSINPDRAMDVYIICHENDYEAAEQIEDYLFGQGMDPILPLIDGSNAARQEDHQRNLDHCDAVLIYYGNSDESWLRKMRFDLDQAVAERTHGFFAKGVLIGPPNNHRKHRIRSQDLIVLKNVEHLDVSLLSEFVGLIRSR